MLSRIINIFAAGIHRNAKIPLKLPKVKPERPQPIQFKRWTIVKGDKVKVRTGKDKGKVATVKKVLRKMNQVIVRNVNVGIKYKSNFVCYVDDGMDQEIKPKLYPIHVSNVGLYDPSVKKAVRVRIAYHPVSGQSLRISKKSGRILHKPKKRNPFRLTRKTKRVAGLKDTDLILAHKITYFGEDFEAIKKQFDEFIKQK